MVTTVALSDSEPATSAKKDDASLVSALSTSAKSPERSTSAKPSPTTPARSNETPVVPGYQVVVSREVGAAYDVPAGWTVINDGRLGPAPNGIIGKGYAIDGKGYCPGSTRTIALLTGTDDTDPTQAATDLGIRSAKLAYSDNTGGTVGTPQPLSSIDGVQHGMFVETTGTVAKAKPGCATQYSIFTFAMPTDGEKGSFVMVIAADTGVPDALDAAAAKRIFTSIRPHES
ncbi:hypothetical protein [Nocardia sp. NPDC052566]|uniref:hypothetical protein n=1 Tax=Nocardia sp. NPDC052566 TaxID=3364330 RepID=UPI0037C7A4B9